MTPKPETIKVTLPSGLKLSVTEKEDHIEIVSHGNDSLLILPSGSTNVVRLASWPHFQPVLPPTPGVPVQVSHNLVQQVMTPKSNGVGTEAVEAVQRSVEQDPRFTEILVEHINATLDKRPSNPDGSGYETVFVRH